METGRQAAAAADSDRTPATGRESEKRPARLVQRKECGRAACGDAFRLGTGCRLLRPYRRFAAAQPRPYGLRRIHLRGRRRAMGDGPGSAELFEAGKSPADMGHEAGQRTLAGFPLRSRQPQYRADRGTAATSRRERRDYSRFREHDRSRSDAGLRRRSGTGGPAGRLGRRPYPDSDRHSAGSEARRDYQLADVHPG